jgi:hypothetical protein
MQENFIHYFLGKKWSNTYVMFLCKVGFREKFNVNGHTLFSERKLLLK